MSELTTITVDVDPETKVATVTLARPDVYNTFNPLMQRELARHLEGVSQRR